MTQICGYCPQIFFDPMKDLINNSLALLETLCSPLGIRASTGAISNYEAVFARDAIMAGIVGSFYKNKKIEQGLLASLSTLRDAQGPQGQIPSNVSLLADGSKKISYGTLSAKTDAPGFYLLGIAYAIRNNLIAIEDWQVSIYKTFDLYDTLEYNGRHLLYVPQGGNWADEYPYHGYLLFDQLLRWWATDLFSELLRDQKLKTKSDQIKSSILSNFDGANTSEKYHKEAYRRLKNKNLPYYLCGFSPAGYREEFDLAANAFACLLFQNNRTDQSLQWISESFDLSPAFWPTIKEGDKQWEDLSSFYLFEFKNHPGHYHNGGIWWIWLGWLAQAMLKNGQLEGLAKLRTKATQVLVSLPNFNFEEYLSADALEPFGTPSLGYTATGILLLFSDQPFDI